MLEVDIQRNRLRIARKGGDAILEGMLHQPIICDDSTWTLESGLLVLTLAKVSSERLSLSRLPSNYFARHVQRTCSSPSMWCASQDNKRPENAAGPSSEWWLGIFAGEDTVDKELVSVQDYARPDQLPPEQLMQAEEGHWAQVQDAKARQKAKDTEAGLSDDKKEVPARAAPAPPRDLAEHQRDP